MALGEAIVPSSEKLFDFGQERSIGLPLLMEFRIWPDAGAFGLNAFDVSIAINTSSRPHFRAFSAGGFDASGSAVLIDPDLELEANGGYNPVPTPPGARTYGLDPVFQIGSMDIVTRISRSYSTWFQAVDSTGNALVDPEYLLAQVVPVLGGFDAGTDVQVALRGATSVRNQEALGDALSLDYYGDHYDRSAMPVPNNDSDANQGIQFIGGTDNWKGNLSDIDGATYYQIRLTCKANVASAATTKVSAVGVSWKGRGWTTDA
ncbi:MAG: hypothetical protein ACI835_000803 [Planctomycetota bacterium]|jgi:hypothetical protein